jgi:hypothetical protein
MNKGKCQQQQKLWQQHGWQHENEQGQVPTTAETLATAWVVARE